MKLVLPVHQGRISPLFDAARVALLVEIREGREVARTELPLGEGTILDRLEVVESAGADTVVCGAVSRSALAQLLRRGLRVWPGVVGNAEEVIACLSSRGALDEEFRMPGWDDGRVHGRPWVWQTATE